MLVVLHPGAFLHCFRPSSFIDYNAIASYAEILTPSDPVMIINNQKIPCEYTRTISMIGGISNSRQSLVHSHYPTCGDQWRVTDDRRSCIALHAGCTEKVTTRAITKAFKHLMLVQQSTDAETNFHVFCSSSGAHLRVMLKGLTTLLTNICGIPE